MPSLAQPDFLGRLREELNAPGWARRLPLLCLELDAHGLAAYPDEVTEFCQAMAMAGVGVGLRRLDQQPMGLTKLHTLPLRYVKLGENSRSRLRKALVPCICCKPSSRLRQGLEFKWW